MAPNGLRREVSGLTNSVIGGRTGIAVAAAALAIVLAGLYVWRTLDAGPAPPPSDIGGGFRLVDQTGKSVNEGLLRGKWSAVFFGYTYCPDVCPTTLANLGRATDELGGLAARFQVVFITVDPDRDTPKALGAYLSSQTFPKGAIGLTGSPSQIAAVAKAYHVYYQRVPQGSSYTMDHSAIVYLMDPKGRFVKPLDGSVAPPQIAGQIRETIAGG